MLLSGATMETLVIWTLVIIAAVSILGWVLSQKLKTSRKEAQIESSTSVPHSNGAPAEAQPSVGAIETNTLPVDAGSVTEQVRSYEIALASLQCEIEALRAENSWLKRRPALDQATGRDLITRGAETDLRPAIDQHPEGLSDDGRKWIPLKRLMVPAIAVGTLIVAVISDYYARDKMTAVPIRSVESQSQANLSTRLTNGSLKPGNVQGDPEATGSQSEDVAKKGRAVAAGKFYKVVRYTRVHSQPNPSSRPVAEIKPGMEIKVVAVRGEWLEVRSLYGRPPGFIRKETVVSKGVG
jgi:hypothetical protein